MNEVLKTIAGRNSCRDYKDEQLTDEQLETIINAALAAPSAMNRQPWRLVVIRDKALIEELDVEGVSVMAAAEDKSAYERTMSRGGKLFYGAPCLIYILHDVTKYSMLDSGILCQNIALAAHSIGLSTCIVGMALMPISGPNGAEIKKRLNFPEGFEFAIGILVGTPNTGKEPHEPDPSKVTYIQG